MALLMFAFLSNVIVLYAHKKKKKALSHHVAVSGFLIHPLNKPKIFTSFGVLRYYDVRFAICKKLRLDCPVANE
jgi:hypothetical protein